MWDQEFFMVETESSITSILTAYEQQEKRRALGGIYALAGFDYQLRFYLADFVDPLANHSKNLDTAGNVFLEALSDVAKQDANDHLVCIQVKRTLTLASLKDAASEVLAIELFLKSQYPSMRGKVKFNLVASQGSSDIQWSDLPATHESYSIISQLLTEERLLSPRIEPDPWWRAITTVWPYLKDPYGFMRFALERAISRGPTPADAQRIRDEICERFKQDLLEKKSLGHPLTLADFQLKEEPSTNLQVGHEITLARLRDHQYMAQTQRLNSLYANLLEYKYIGQRELRSEVQVFWLSGRSGAGKSVILLHTIEKLVYEGFNVLWLKGNSELLEPTLRVFKEAHKQDLPDFIAIDDLYDHDARNRIDLNRLGEFIDESENQNWPIILTCGPTEFADSFEEDATYRGFNLNRYQIVPLAAKEAEEVEVWYQQRTGKPPLKGSAFNQAADEDNGLFISLAVELAHGDLKTFAQRFAQRIQLNDLDKALWLPLALNRLYLRAPYDWLTKEDREKLATLNHEGDFNLLETADERQIVRLTHPHLANALYLALRKPANSEAYTNDLVDTFHRALTEQNADLVSQLLRLFSGREQGMAIERLSIVKLPDLALKCAKHWHEHPPVVSDADSLADMATSWACWATTAPNITSTFNTNVLLTALSHLGTAYKAWSICWQHLAEHYPKDEELFFWAVKHLSDPLFIRHPNWSFVWEYCLQNEPNRSEIWHNIALEWLQHSLLRPDWHIVWQKLLPENVEPDWEQHPVLALGRRRLYGEKNGHVWARVMQDLLRLVEPNSSTAIQLFDLAKTWLTGREESNEWNYIWQALLAQRDVLPESLPLSELLQCGATWLTGREDRDEWNYIWQALLAQRDALPESLPLSELLERGATWLTGREDRDQWNYIWQALLGQRDTLPESLPLSELLQRGAIWLTGREDREQWAHVWQALLAQQDTLPENLLLSELLERGATWLTGHEDRDEWAHVWEALLAQRDALPESLPLSELLQRGATWLTGREDRDEWNYIWQALLAQRDVLPESLPLSELLQHGATWLTGHDYDVKEWGIVCERLLELKYQNGDFFAIAADWLTQASGKAEWPILAAKFIVATPHHATSTKFAVTLAGLIHANPNKGYWFKTQKLVSNLIVLETLPPTVKDWLQVLHDRKNHPAWKEAHQSLTYGFPIKGSAKRSNDSGQIIELANGLISYYSFSSNNHKLTKNDIRDFFVQHIDLDKELIQVGLSKATQLIIGEKYDGCVGEYVSYGVFIAIGGQSALLHRTQCSNWFELSRKFPSGSQICVEILSVTDRGAQLRYAGPELTIEGEEIVLSVGEVYNAYISGIKKYGLFLQVGVHFGLLHRTHLPPNTDILSQYFINQKLDVQLAEIKSDGKLVLKLPDQ